MIVRPLSMLLSLLIVSACSIAEQRPNWMSSDVAGPEPDHRFLVANQISAIVGDPLKAGTLEISSARRADGMVGASWQVCIRAWTVAQPPRYFAIFIQNQRVVSSRLSVVLDRCESEAFTPFYWYVELNKSR